MSGDTCPWCGANIVCGKDYSCGSDSYGAVPRQSDLCKYRCAERRLSELGSELSLAAETITRQRARIAELEAVVNMVMRWGVEFHGFRFASDGVHGSDRDNLLAAIKKQAAKAMGGVE